MEGYEHTEERRQSVKIRIEKGERFHKRLEMFVSQMTSYFKDTQMYHDKIQWLVSEAQSNPVLRIVLKSLDILSTLMTSPHRIYQRLKDTYDHIDQWLKYKDVLEQIEITNTLKQRCMGSQSHDTIKLVVSIENLKKSLTSLRDDLTAITDTVKTDKTVLNDIYTYEGVKTEVLRLQEQYQYYIKYLSDKHELDKITFLKKSLEDLRSNTYVRMSEVERTLRAQSGLKERYQEEVLNELNRIERDMAELLLIEKALIDIPKEITIDFLNGIFEQANKIIDAVWTIPFRIEPLAYDSDLNYEFMVSGDNQTLREMSECSEGQTEILSLAINLALRIELGHLNIPIVLDETGRTFDEKHKQNLVFLLKKLLDEKIISQLFLISHHAIIHDSFSNIETLVIREDNVMLPEKFNEHCVIV
jgi:DNA repair exonuclease SbcCD ATPase subunit